MRKIKKHKPLVKGFWLTVKEGIVSLPSGLLVSENILSEKVQEALVEKADKAFEEMTEALVKEGFSAGQAQALLDSAKGASIAEFFLESPSDALTIDILHNYIEQNGEIKL